MTRLDFDHDGDLDVIASSLTSGVVLFRNDLARQGRWLTLQIQVDREQDVSSDALGTSVTLKVGDRLFYRDLQGAGGGAGGTQQSNEIHFGLGDIDQVDRMTIRFSRGIARELVDVPVNRRLIVSPRDRVPFRIDETPIATAEATPQVVNE